MKIFSIVIALCAMFSSVVISKAEIFSITPDETMDEGKPKKDAQIARIYYLAEVSPNRVAELVGALDNLNTNYKSLRKIYLYINSNGGDMDSGSIAYWAVKSSRTPVTAVNLSMVASSATIMFCGAGERLSMPGGTFLLHAPKTWSDRTYVRSDELSNVQRYLELYGKMLTRIYRECTSIPDEEVAKLIRSENDSLLLSPAQAKERRLITDISDRVVDAPVSVFIRDDEKNGG